jgi:hypothetical protein
MKKSTRPRAIGRNKLASALPWASAVPWTARAARGNLNFGIKPHKTRSARRYPQKYHSFVAQLVMLLVLV